MSNGIDIGKLKKGKTAGTKQKQGGNSITELLNRDIQLFGDGLGDAWRERFYAELHIMLSSGLDIKTALELTENEQPKPKHKELVKQIREVVIGGQSLFEAMQKSGKFTPYEYFSIRIGEETGRLNLILNDLVGYYNKRIKNQRQLISAFTYPAMVCGTALMAVVFMLNFVVPMFADVFLRFGGELPWLTKVVMMFSDFMQHYILYLFLGVVAIAAAIYSQRKKDGFRDVVSRIVVRLPVIGQIIQSVYLARFSQVMSLLIASKVPMLQAVDMVQKMIGYYPIEQSMEQAKKDIMNGVHLYASLAKSSIYPNRMVSLVKVGEEVNQLDTMFQKLADQFSADVEHKTGVLSSMLEPFLIIFLALIVGVILVAMYLPMFQLSSGLGG